MWLPSVDSTWIASKLAWPVLELDAAPQALQAPRSEGEPRSRTRYSRRISLEGASSRCARLAIVGEQQQPGGIHVQPADDDPAPARWRRQSLEDGRPALRIAARGHLAHGLVIQQHLDGFAAPAEIERLAIEADPVGVGGAIAERGDAIVDGHAAGANPLFDAAARTVARARQQLLQSFSHGGGSITNCYMAIPSPASSRLSGPA